MATDPLKLVFGTLLGKRLPVTEGVLGIDGISHPVEIRRDAFGIPHIDAATDADAWFGLGFCQGQDRSFQLESLLRVVRGTLSEVLGAETVPIDRLARRIGFKHAAIEMEPLLDDDERTSLEAFAAGVNAGRTAGLERRPHELALLRSHPTPFEATDTLGVLLLQAFGLASNWDAELARYTVLVNDGPEALEALDPTYPEWHAVTSPPATEAGPGLARLLDDLDIFRRNVPLGGGSNNWVLAGSRTTTGRPLLANDPHLAPTLPSHWYLAHVRTPRWAIAGAVLAATPGFASAHNGNVAWGVTAGLIDNTDLFLEQLGPDGRSVRRGDTFVACRVRREVIAVRGSASIEEDVLITDRGPIIGDAFIGTTATFSMAATWLRPERISSLLRVNTATTITDFRSALADWHGPTLNIVCADASGTIGWQMIGQAPIRTSGYGTIPLPAWDPAVGWEDRHVPFDRMPSAENPAAGYLATANNRPTTGGDEPFLGTDWIDGHRIGRINRLLEGRSGWDVPSALAAQLDTVSLLWEEIREPLMRPGPGSGAETVHGLLAAWDGDVAADSPAAAAFVLSVKELQRRIARAKAPRSAEAALGKGFSPSPIAPNSLFAFSRDGHLARLLRNRPDGWFDDWDDEIASALASVESRLRADFGPDPRAWAWGTIRPLTLTHPVGSRKPLDRVFNIGPMPWGGDFSTVSQAGAIPLDPLSNPSAIASLRMAVDVGNWDNSRFSLPGGQSGNPMSPHYADQVEPWRSGTGVVMAFTEPAVAAATVETLHLVPRRPL